MPPQPPSAPSQTNHRRELLGGLAQALQLLAQRILPQAETALEVAELAARAEELAAEAWTLGSARIPDAARASALQEAFRSFIAEAAELSARAARAAAAVRAVGTAIDTHGTELARLAGSPEAENLAVLRATLRPMLATLEELPRHIAESKAVAGDVSAMGSSAAKLGQEALAAQDHRIPAGAKALALYRSLRTIAEEAATLSSTLLAEGQQLRRTIAGIATDVGRIATPAPPAPAGDASSRLARVVAQGTGTSTGPPAGALDWGIGRRS